MLCIIGTNERENFWDFWVLGSKYTKFLSFLKQQTSFSSNFTTIFRVMRHDCYVFFWLKFYILSTKGVYQSTKWVKFYVSSRKSQILHFDGLLLSKSWTFSAKKVQKSYLSWQWRVMLSLNKAWSCGFKTGMRYRVIFY